MMMVHTTLSTMANGDGQVFMFIIYISGFFQGVLGTQFRSLGSEKIRSLEKIRKIRSLQVHTRYPTFSFKKTVYIYIFISAFHNLSLPQHA